MITTDIRSQMVTLLDALTGFSGSDPTVIGKQDVYEKPTRSVYLGKLTRERLSMRPATFARSLEVWIAIYDQVAEGTLAEDHLLQLGLDLENEVEDALIAKAFPVGVSLELAEQVTTVTPDTPTRGVLTQVYIADWGTHLS